MKNKKTFFCYLFLVFAIILAVSGFTYAYFVASVSGNGNNTGNTSQLETAELAEIVYNNGENFTSDGSYPGYKNVHTFTIKPKDGTKGIGRYQILLDSVVDDVFIDDIIITLYKSTDKTNDNVIREEGVLTQTGNNQGESFFEKIDTIKLNGSPVNVWGNEILKTENKLVLEEVAFDANMLETTYYLVYEYLNRENNQDIAQGKSFKGKVSVNLVNPFLPKQRLLSEIVKEKIVISNDGVYEVSHNDAIIGSHMNEKQTNNLKMTEYRYAGSNPNNYVLFNDELWRMIGLVNTPEGQRVKLVRKDSIGNYSWDTSASNVNNGEGINNWKQADVMNLLNKGAYYNRTTGICYTGKNNTSIPCDFSKNGLTNDSKAMIDSVTWNIGGITNFDTKSNGLARHFYNYERGNDFYSGNSSTWFGEIGLMNPSDYGYGTSGGENMNRTTCLAKELFHWRELVECNNNNWLYSNVLWTMSTRATVSYDAFVNSNIVTYNLAYINHSVLPTLYLMTNVSAMLGDGTESNPYSLFL